MRRTSLLAASVLAFAGLVALPATAATPTTLQVNTAADLNDAPCTGASTAIPNPMSLRDAVCLANNLPATAPVVINVPAGVYALSVGELDLGSTAGENVTVVGQGSSAAATVINAGGHSRVFNIDRASVGGVTASLQNLTVFGGADSTAGGAGILGGSAGSLPADSLSLSGVVVAGNTAGGAAPSATNRPGGGLQFLGGSLTITNSAFSNNEAGSSPGSAIAYQAYGAGAEAFSMTSTTISGNSSTNLATATDKLEGAVVLGSPTNATTGPSGIPMTITGSIFTGNVVTGTNGPANGAALALESGGLSVTGSSFTGNKVTGTGSQGGAISIVAGAASLQGNRIVDNVAPSAAQGSGVALVGVGTIDATDNWWGCNGGPGSTGCDTTYPAGMSTTPRLVLSGPAVSTFSNGTASVSADLRHNSAGVVVSGGQAGLNGVAMGFSNPSLARATCAPASVAMTGGTASGACTLDPHGAAGAGQVAVTVDHQTINIPVTVKSAPTITAALSSSGPRSSYGWYRTPVTVAFTCAAPGAPLAGSCPEPVKLSGNGANQSVTRTISATDGGSATATASGINIDATAPSVSISGAINGRYYPKAPRAACVAQDALSGIASCVLTLKNKQGLVTVIARAMDKAGNVAAAHLTYRMPSVFIRGAHLKNGVYMLKLGRPFTIVALLSGNVPRYYGVVRLGHKLKPAPAAFKRAGKQSGMSRWTLRTGVARGVDRHDTWIFGVKIGSTIYQVKFRVR